jgi:hypothetical protein
VPLADLQSVNYRTQQQRMQLEMNLKEGEQWLLRVASMAKEELEQLDRRVAAYEMTVVQARADWSVL